jgi:hypothetical protein
LGDLRGGYETNDGGEVVREGRGGGEASEDADATRSGGALLKLTAAGDGDAMEVAGGVGGGRRRASLGHAVGDDGLTGDEGADNDEANVNVREGVVVDVDAGVDGSSGGIEMERAGSVPRCNSCEPTLVPDFNEAAGTSGGDDAADVDGAPERAGKAEALALLSRVSDWLVSTRLRLGTDAEVIGGEWSWLCFCSVVVLVTRIVL